MYLEPQKIPNKQSGEKIIKLDLILNHTIKIILPNLNYTIKHSSKQHGIGRKTDTQINRTELRAQK